jgi:hypothetical protein
VVDLQGFLERMKGLEPSTFCMARAARHSHHSLPSAETSIPDPPRGFGAVMEAPAFPRMRDQEDRASSDRPNTDPSSPAANDAVDQRGLTVIRRYEPVDDLEERLARIYAMLSLPPFPTD